MSSLRTQVLVIGSGAAGQTAALAAALEHEYRPHRVVFLGDGKPSAHLHFHFIAEPASCRSTREQPSPTSI